MGLAQFTTFFGASAGAGAALVGLLFVAVSIAPERVFGKEAGFEHQLVASSAFTALINAFFISLGSLIPSTSTTLIATVVLVLGAIALMNSVALLINTLRRTTVETNLRSVVLVIGGVGIYSLEVWNAVSLLRTPSNIDPVYTICALLVAVYGFGIVRAWQLLGADRRGVISFLVPLLLRQQQRHDDGEMSPESSAPEPKTAQAIPVDAQDQAR